MSIMWKEILRDDIEISGDKKSLEIWIGADGEGNNYAEISIDLIRSVLKNFDEKEQDEL